MYSSFACLHRCFVTLEADVCCCCFVTLCADPPQDVYQPRGQFKKAKVAFCIHNIAFQGRFWPESFKDMALPPASLAKLGFKDGYNKVRTLTDRPWDAGACSFAVLQGLCDCARVVQLV